VESAFSKIDRAIADYTEAIRLRKDRTLQSDSLLYNWRANLYLSHGETDLALADLQMANRLEPQNARVLYHRGLAYARKRMVDRAIAEVETGRKFAHGDKALTALLVQIRADSLALSGRIDEATKGIAETVTLDPDRGHPVLAARAWFIDRPNGDDNAALKKLDETAKGGMIMPFLYRGLIYSRLEMPDRALAEFDEVIDRVKKTRREWFAIADYLVRWPALLIGRGETLLLKGKLDLALADANEAVQFAPRFLLVAVVALDCAGLFCGSERLMAFCVVLTASAPVFLTIAVLVFRLGPNVLGR
jgi:tetratricopeptide (TPR) repeat protein